MLFHRLRAGVVICLIVVGAMIQLADSQSPRPKVKSNYLSPSLCTRALAEHAVCATANQHTLDYMKANNLTATTVVQDVRTGALVVFAASDPSKLDVGSEVLPLSVVKLFLAAS